MHWELRPRHEELCRDLAARLEISPVLAALLANRGVGSVAEAREFLWPHLDHLADPFRMKDMDRAVDRVLRAVRAREPVVVYGDYDVDGITGTALLLRFLRFLGLEPRSYIPCRLEEGYGLNLEAARKIAAEGASLLISIDNGTGSFEEIAELGRLGVDVIVTDHHETNGEVPDAVAVLNPKRPDCPYPFKLLAGVGVAFKLVLATAERLRPERRRSPEFQSVVFEALALAALGTVADVVPLVGENRVLTKHGLRSLAHVETPGIHALLEVARISDREIVPEDIAFRIGPRLNAAGRMGCVQLALDMLTTESRSLARAAGARLEEENTRRQQVERAILDECRSRLRDDPKLLEAPGLVLGGDGWHRGVLGIVAARLADEHGRPVLLIGFDGNAGRGSGRSVPGFALLDALRDCREWLGAFGGHAHAAGLEIERDRFAPFVRAFEEAVGRRTGGRPTEPTLAVDLELPLQAVGRDLIREIERLEPHGERNPRPVFSVSGATLVGAPRAIGRTGDHLQLTLRQGGAALRAVGFRMASWLDRLRDGSPVDAAFTPRLNRWNGREDVEILLHDLRT